MSTGLRMAAKKTAAAARLAHHRQPSRGFSAGFGVRAGVGPGCCLSFAPPRLEPALHFPPALHSEHLFNLD